MANHAVVICTDNSGYEVSLELRKLYEMLPDAEADTHGQVRIIDESGEDYLYPKTFFSKIDLPREIVEKLFHAA